MFIVLEGIDGCGKSTQAERLEALLRERGESVVRTREPGGWPGGEKLREFALHGEFAHRWSEFFLFLLDRCEHAARVVSPALESGSIVVCERYNASTIAYQLFGRMLAKQGDLSVISHLAALADFPEPDLIFYLDVPLDAAKSRVDARGRADRFEGEGAAYYERVRRGYDAQYEAAKPGTWVKIDASRSADEVFGDIAFNITKRR